MRAFVYGYSVTFKHNTITPIPNEYTTTRRRVSVFNNSFLRTLVLRHWTLGLVLHPPLSIKHSLTSVHTKPSPSYPMNIKRITRFNIYIYNSANVRALVESDRYLWMRYGRIPVLWSSLIRLKVFEYSRQIV